MDKSNLTGMGTFGFTKGYHDVLLMKLEVIGLTADSLRWFHSYLSGRTQLVDVHATCSSFANVTCGVPQGYILGPLFIPYLCEWHGCAKYKKILLYADYTAISVSDKHVDATEARLGTALETISVWLIGNKLHPLVRLSLFCLGRNENSQTVAI